MCAMFTTVVDGNPVMFTLKFAVAAVMTLFASRVMLKSIVAVPLPLDSALVMGGVSCAGVIAAVKRIVDVPGPLEDGDVVLELEPEQPVARSTPSTAIAGRFICCDTPFLRIRRTSA